MAAPGCLFFNLLTFCLPFPPLIGVVGVAVVAGVAVVIAVAVVAAVGVVGFLDKFNPLIIIILLPVCVMVGVTEGRTTLGVVEVGVAGVVVVVAVGVEGVAGVAGVEGTGTREAVGVAGVAVAVAGEGGGTMLEAVSIVVGVSGACVC